jgi:hypothetical protein
MTLEEQLERFGAGVGFNWTGFGWHGWKSCAENFWRLGQPVK